MSLLKWSEDRNALAPEQVQPCQCELLPHPPESSCGMCGMDGTQEEVQDWAPNPCMNQALDAKCFPIKQG